MIGAAPTHSMEVTDRAMSPGWVTAEGWVRGCCASGAGRGIIATSASWVLSWRFAMNETTVPIFEVVFPVPELPKADREYAAFERLLPQLLAPHAGKHV